MPIVGQAEIDQKKLDQKWRVANGLDIRLDDGAQHGPARILCLGAGDAHDESERHRAGGQLDREPRTQQQLVELAPDGTELKDIVHAIASTSL